MCIFVAQLNRSLL